MSALSLINLRRDADLRGCSIVQLQDGGAPWCLMRSTTVIGRYASMADLAEGLKEQPILDGWRASYLRRDLRAG